MYMVSMMTYCFSVRGFGHPVSLKPHFGHPVMEILAKTLLSTQIGRVLIRPLRRESLLKEKLIQVL